MHIPMGEEEGDELLGQADPVTTLNREMERIGDGWFAWTVAFILGLGNAADAVEVLGFGYILPKVVAEWNISDTQKGALTGAVFAGMLIGGCVCGFMSDRMGRKPCLLVALGVNAVFGLLASMAPSWPLLFFCRLCSGVGVGGSVPSTFTMAAELVPPAERGSWINIVALFWSVGSVCAAGVAALVFSHLGFSWRVYSAILATPAACGCVLVALFVPESPRFLLKKELYEDAEQVLALIARANGKSFETGCIVRTVTSGSQTEQPTQLTFWESIVLLFSPPLLRPVSLMLVIFFVVSFGWYGLLMWIPTLFAKLNLNLDEYLSELVVAGATIPGGVVCALIIDKYGRKKILVVSILLSSMFVLILALVQKSPVLVILCASFFNGVSVGAWNAMDCLSAEILPTSVRATGMAAMLGVNRIGSLLSQFFFAYLIDESVALLLTINSALLLVGALAAISLPRDPTGAVLED